MEGGHKICIRDLNPHIVCDLCAGYFIDATTITECLHTFCKSCIVKYLQTSKHCPNCNTKVHETQPLLNLKADRSLQDIVYKVVPGLWKAEMKRREDFEKTRGLSMDNSSELDHGIAEEMSENVFSNQHYYVHDELIHICLEPYRNGLNFKADKYPPLQKFVRCSARAQVFHIKKLIKRIWPVLCDKELEVLCSGCVIPENHCLKRIWLLHGKEQEHNGSFQTNNPPLHLQFVVKS